MIAVNAVLLDLLYHCPQLSCAPVFHAYVYAVVYFVVYMNPVAQMVVVSTPLTCTSAHPRAFTILSADPVLEMMEKI